MRLALMTWPQVEDYLRSRKTIVIPIGSTEQHGPTGLVGTDYLTAEAIALEAGSRAAALVAPPLTYGMALHHLGFPGSAALKPSTLLQVTVEVVESFKRHGFKNFLFVNGHGGNIPTLTAAFSEIKYSDDRSRLDLMNWWKLPEVVEYENQNFGDQNGFHATVGEVAVTMHLFPEAFVNIPRTQFKIERPPHNWPLSPVEFREVFFDGRMESNPGLATQTHGKALFEIAVSAIVRRINELT